MIHTQSKSIIHILHIPYIHSFKYKAKKQLHFHISTEFYKILSSSILLVLAIVWIDYFP